MIRSVPDRAVLIAEGRLGGGLPSRERPGNLMEHIRRQTLGMVDVHHRDSFAIQEVSTPIRQVTSSAWRRIIDKHELMLWLNRFPATLTAVPFHLREVDLEIGVYSHRRSIA